MQFAGRLWRRTLPLLRHWPLAWAWLIIWYISANRVDPDFGWHFVTGKYIWSHGIPATDIFTYTARDFAWVNHEWAHDVLVYGVAQLGGYPLLAVVFATLWTGALWLAARRRLEPLVLATVLLAVMPYVGIRGVTWSVVGLAITLAVLGDSSEGGRPAPRLRWWWLVPLFWIWGNLHAGVAVGLAMVGMAAVWWRSQYLALVGVLAALVTLINPYGWRMYEELWRTMSDGQLGGYIVEWAPLEATWASLPFVTLVVVVLWYTRSNKLEWWRALGFVLAAVWSRRHTPLMVIATLPLVQAQVRWAWDWLRQSLAAVKPRGIWRWWPIGLGVAALGLLPLLALWWPSGGGVKVNSDEVREAMVALRDRPCAGRVFNDYNFGGRMIWALPGVPVYIDGRMPSWSGPDGRYMDRYVKVLKGEAFTAQEFSRYNVQCVLISTEHEKLVTWLKGQPEWQVDYDGRDVELWRRQNP